MTLAQLTEFLGWVAVINIAFLALAAALIMLLRKPIAKLHSKLLGVEEQEIYAKYFDFMSTYKVLTLIFSVAPYIALKIMGY